MVDLWIWGFLYNLHFSGSGKYNPPNRSAEFPSYGVNLAVSASFLIFFASRFGFLINIELFWTARELMGFSSLGILCFCKIELCILW